MNQSFTKILVVTHNRVIYTRKTLERLISNVGSNVSILIWDNNSNHETRTLLRNYLGHPNIEKIHFNNENSKLREPTNWLWNQSYRANYLSKVDDDCLLPFNWIKILKKAHEDIPEAGILGCWRFLPEDYNEFYASKKIQRFGNHQIMRNCWVEGSGYLMKRSVIDDVGLIKSNETFTDYCIRAAAHGYINGWYYPFLYQEHMDDPRVPNTGINSEEDFQRLMPLTALNFDIQSLEAWTQRLKQSAQRLQMYSYNPKDFIGLKPRIKRKFLSLVGKQYLPLVK